MPSVLIWWDDPADAFTNMAADELLAAEAERRGGLVVRLYGWSPASVSLGAFQPIAAARGLAAIAGLPVVRRPSGGGALVHGSDLTYAAAIPKQHPWGRSPQDFYDAFHATLVAELRRRGVPARQHAATVAAGGQEDRFLCFDRRATGDVVVPGPDGTAAGPLEPKVLGSAQRRLAGAVLQHGSLLVRANPRVGPEARHPGLLDLYAEVCPDVAHLAGAWLTSVARLDGAGVAWQESGFIAGREAAVAAAAGRFATDRWLERR
jgi:lipoate-protein ligase A